MQTRRQTARGRLHSLQRSAICCTIGRRGAATLDYVLVLGAILPVAGVSIYMGGRIIKMVYEMTCILVSWPFM